MKLKDADPVKYKDKTFVVKETGERYLSDGATWIKQTSDNVSTPITIRTGDQPIQPEISSSQLFGGGLIDQGVQSATFGFGDELAGLMSQLTGGDYASAQQQYLDRLASFERANPKAALGAQVTGALGTGLLGGIKLAGTKLGQKGIESLQRSGLLGRVAKGGGASGVAGLLTGGLRGAGEAETLGDIPSRAIQTGVGEGVVSAIFGPVVSEFAGAIPKLSSFVKQARNPEIRAAYQIERALANTGKTKEEIAQTVADLGDRGALADLDGVTDLLEILGQVQGKSKIFIEQTLKKRSRDTTDTLMHDLFPNTASKIATKKELLKIRREQASPKYKEAFEIGIKSSPTLERIYKAVSVEDDLVSSIKDMSTIKEILKGEKIDPKTWTREGSIPTLEGWQNIKVALDDKINSLYKSGNTGKAQLYKEMRKDLLTELDTQNPVFKEARNIYAGSKQIEDVIDNSKNFLNKSSDEFLEEISSYSKAEMEAVKIGVVQSIKDKVEKGQWTHDAGKIFRTPSVEKKMKALFTDTENPEVGEQLFNNFMDKVDSISRQQQTFDAVRGNSATARRLQGLKELEGDSFIDTVVAESILTGSPEFALGRGVTRKGAEAYNEARKRMRPLGDQDSNLSMAKQLLEQTPEGRLGNQVLRTRLLDRSGAQFNKPIPKGLLPPVAGTTVARGLQTEEDAEIRRARNQGLLNGR